MSPVVPSYDLAPALAVAATGALLAALPLAWFWSRHRSAGSAGSAGGSSAASADVRLRALALLTLFLTFDLVLLGAFTRLSDSGLGCPDWPGCYGHATPVGASGRIAAAEALQPTGAVTHGKAWVEMAHRYSATAIGVLMLTLAVLAFVESRRRRTAVSPVWALGVLAWVVAQGAFGALTVTMNLYPAIVTLHLLGGLGLLAVLALLSETHAPRAWSLPAPLRAGVVAVAALAVVQIALGGWVSTNYAVLACREFPTCQGAWWPDMDFGAGFVLRRALGASGDGGWLPFPALTAIHMAHRLGACVLLPALLALAWRLLASGVAEVRPWALALLGVAAWQTASGLGNVLLGWPLATAVAHTAGSGALVVVMTIVLARSARGAVSPVPLAVGRPAIAS